MYQWKEETQDRDAQERRRLGGDRHDLRISCGSGRRRASIRAASSGRRATSIRRCDTAARPIRRATRRSARSARAPTSSTGFPQARTCRSIRRWRTSCAGRVKGPVHVADGRIYLGENPSQPRIGDLRVSFQLAPAGPTSIVGRQAGTGFAEYQTKAGDSLLMVRPGTHVRRRHVRRRAAREPHHDLDPAVRRRVRDVHRLHADPQSAGGRRRRGAVHRQYPVGGGGRSSRWC